MNYPFNQIFYDRAATVFRDIAEKENIPELKEITGIKLCEYTEDIKTIYRSSIEQLCRYENDEYIYENLNENIAIIITQIIANNIKDHIDRQIFESLLLRIS